MEIRSESDALFKCGEWGLPVNKEQLRARLEELKVSPKKSLGQNFLVSNHVVEKIIGVVTKKGGWASSPTGPSAKEESSGGAPSEAAQHLLEIGPGVGALTDHLKGLPAESFRLIELDEVFASYWKSQDLDVIEEDALKLPWSGADFQRPNTHLVSNLPYQISAPLVIELSSLVAPWISTMTLMFQKEVADRITASPRTKAYGIISVLAQNRWKIKKVVDAGPACFHPRPRVTSRVLHFERMEEGFGSPEFLKFVRLAFQNRRKFLIKSLKGLSSSMDWEKTLTELKLSPQVRAEELTPDQWRSLFRELRNHGS